MATKSATDLNSKPCFSGEEGNLGVYFGTYTGAPATGEVWRLCKIPAGIKVLRVTVANEALADGVSAAAPADIGYAPVSGASGSANCFANDAALEGASTGTNYLFADAPVSVTEESYVTVTFGTVVSDGASGKLSAIIEGELFGAK